MALIPTVPLGKLPFQDAMKLSALPSVEVVDERGNYIGTLIIPPLGGGTTIFDEIKTQAEYLGVRSNTVLSPSIIANVNNLTLIAKKIRPYKRKGKKIHANL